MCATCGCSPDADRDHGPRRPHALAPPGARGAPAPLVPGSAPRLVQRARVVVSLEEQVLGKNDRAAARVRAALAERGILALNLVSSPGAGKTTLVERTLRDLSAELPIAVVEGDQETPLDAERIRKTGCPVVQINTGRGCHLDAEMVERALRELDLSPRSLLLVENVGNLVCPALFDLGERAKVVVASTPEGEEKPLKYPHMFRASALMLLNKIDLAPHVSFDAERCLALARQVNPRLETIAISATRGDGLDRWYAWLRGQLQRAGS